MKMMDIQGEQGFRHQNVVMLASPMKCSYWTSWTPRAIELEPQAAPVDELEGFPVGPLDPTKLL